MADERNTPQTPSTGTPHAAPPAVARWPAAATAATLRRRWAWPVTIGALALGLVAVRGVLSPRGRPTSEPTRGTTPLSADAIFARASPAVVQVLIQDQQGRTIGSGSGFLVSARGWVATNYHVVVKAHAARVVLVDKTDLPVLGAAALDQDADLAIIKVAGEVRAQPLELGGDDLPAVGTKVYAIGSPLGSFANTLSDGLVSAHREKGAVPYFPRMPTMIQTTAPISPGSSGGPLLAPDGKVVGVTTLTFAPAGGENLNLAVPVAHVARLLHRAEAAGQLTRFPVVQEPDALAYIERGNAWTDKNDYDRAIQEYDEAIRLDPTCALAHYRRGLAWYYKGSAHGNQRDLDKAYNDFAEARRLDPKHFH